MKEKYARHRVPVIPTICFSCSEIKASLLMWVELNNRWVWHSESNQEVTFLHWTYNLKQTNKQANK